MPASDYVIETGNEHPVRAPQSTVSASGRLCVVGGVIAVAGAIWSTTVDPAAPSNRIRYPFSVSEFRVTEVIWTLTHLLTFLGVLGLVRAGAAGRGRPARAGAPLALLGMMLLVPCELAFAFIPNSREDSTAGITASTAIGLAAIAAGIGLSLLGVGVLREHYWTGWARWVPLAAGVYGAVVLTAVAPLSNDVFLYGIAGWNLTLAFIGIALITTRFSSDARATGARTQS